jgi:hypothetical protein
VGKILLVFLGTLVAVEVIVVIGLAAALFLLGATETIFFGATMLVVTAIAGVLTLLAVRPRR